MRQLCNFVKHKCPTVPWLFEQQIQSSRSNFLSSYSTSSARKKEFHNKNSINLTQFLVRGMKCASNSFESTAEATKLATFRDGNGTVNVGIVRGDYVWALKDSVGESSAGQELINFSSMESAIKSWSVIKDRVSPQGSGTPLTSVTLLAPIPLPAGTIMCIGKNYVDHVKEVDTWSANTASIAHPDVPEHPIVFTKASQSVIGPNDSIKCPVDLSDSVDYEAELAVIIGKEGKGIAEDTALEYIFGYTIMNDVTARDLQKKHQQWFLGKSCDTFCPMGPWIVPASEINGQDLSIQCWVDGEFRQDARTSQLIFGIPKLISAISECITLKPGDIIATGTPAGVGSGFKPPRHLKPGQVVRIKIEGIGELENSVV